MTELRPAIEVAREAFLAFRADGNPTEIITADRRALVDAIVAMLRERAKVAGNGPLGVPEWAYNSVAREIAQRFGGAI